MGKFVKEFKEFISKGNVMDLAVGVIIGGTFTKIVNSVVNDILNPIVALLVGRTNFANMFVVLNGDGTEYKTLEAATEAGVSVLAYGNLIQVIIDFLITAICIFLIVKAVNKLREAKEKGAEKLGLKKTEEAEEKEEEKK